MKVQKKERLYMVAITLFATISMCRGMLNNFNDICKGCQAVIDYVAKLPLPSRVKCFIQVTCLIIAVAALGWLLLYTKKHAFQSLMNARTLEEHNKCVEKEKSWPMVKDILDACLDKAEKAYARLKTICTMINKIKGHFLSLQKRIGATIKISFRYTKHLAAISYMLIRRFFQALVINLGNALSMIKSVLLIFCQKALLMSNILQNVALNNTVCRFRVPICLKAYSKFKIVYHYETVVLRRTYGLGGQLWANFLLKQKRLLENKGAVPPIKGPPLCFLTKVCIMGSVNSWIYEAAGFIKFSRVIFIQFMEKG